MPSFDVVSSPDLQEIDNAINNTKREVDNRFDFKNTNSTIERSDYSITIETTDNTKLNQFNDILKNNIVRRKVDPKFIHVKSTETASGNRVRQFVDILNGISKDDAKISYDGDWTSFNYRKAMQEAGYKNGDPVEGEMFPTLYEALD